MFCENCGKQLSDDARFCSSCGRPTGTTQAQPQPTPYQQPQQHYQQPQYQPQSGGLYSPPNIMPISPGAHQIQLQPGELLYAVQYGSLIGLTTASGEMYITNMRLVWAKSLARALISARSIALVQKDQVVIPLESVASADGSRVRGNKSGLTVITNDGKKHLFLVTSKMGYFNEEAQASKAIMLNVLNYASSINNQGIR